MGDREMDNEQNTGCVYNRFYWLRARTVSGLLFVRYYVLEFLIQMMMMKGCYGPRDLMT